MVFTSHVFLFYYLPAVLLIYYLLPRGRNAFLTAASYVFYGWWEPWFVSLMLTSTILDFVCGGIIGNPASSPARRKGALLAAICGDLGLLAFFKYYTFTAENLNRLAAVFGMSALPAFEIVLPIGISFYTFESLSYTIDVYRGTAKPARTFSDISCFVSLFPHLVAGPIVRYNVLAEQIARRDHTWEKFSYGVALFMAGFAKKILLANPMGAVADEIFGAASPRALEAWFGVTAYAFQIYFDFSGYSDMAIGLGRMFGFLIPINFASPYRSGSITEFWRRWHISLSTWLRDYLYVPLGGNRRGPRRTYLNLALVMLLGGLWHGANWTFVAWGAYHGALLAFERWMGKTSAFWFLPLWGRRAATFVLVLFSWVLFRAPDFAHAQRFFASLFGFGGDPNAGLLAGLVYSPYTLAVFAASAWFAFQRTEIYEWLDELTWPKAALLAPAFAAAVAVMWSQAFNPFLYYQF